MLKRALITLATFSLIAGAVATTASAASSAPRVLGQGRAAADFAVAAVSPPSTGASVLPFDKQVWHLPNLDPIVSEVAGVPLQVNFSDNQAEWNYLAGGEGVLGWTCITCSPSQTLYNPFDGGQYYVYRTAWFAPEIHDILSNLSAFSYKDVGMAFLTLDHEGMHWRLFSRDEGHVNACALKDLPRFLTTDFGIPATTAQTVSVPQQYRVKVRYWAKVHGRRVARYRYVSKTRYVDQQQTVTNPLITNIVNGAAQFMREDQPYPYNAGTC
jgi:hypothetical protein